MIYRWRRRLFIGWIGLFGTIIYHRDFRFELYRKNHEYTPIVGCVVAITAFSFLFEPQEEPTIERFINALQTEIFNGQAATMFAVFEKTV